EELQRLRGDAVAEHRAKEGGGAADQPDQPEPLPRRAHGAERADDAEPLGGVVEGEADDQNRGQADVSGARRYPDGETLGEVVKPDRDRDRHPRSQGPRTGGGFIAEKLLGTQDVDRTP